MNDFETRTNAARAAIGRPPVRRYDDLPQNWAGTVIGELFGSACNNDMMAAQELHRIAAWVAHRKKMASWDAYSGRK